LNPNPEIKIYDDMTHLKLSSNFRWMDC
jgi:hypothetical protein